MTSHCWLILILRPTKIPRYISHKWLSNLLSPYAVLVKLIFWSQVLELVHISVELNACGLRFLSRLIEITVNLDLAHLSYWQFVHSFSKYSHFMYLPFFFHSEQHKTSCLWEKVTAIRDSIMEKRNLILGFDGNNIFQ